MFEDAQWRPPVANIAGTHLAKSLPLLAASLICPSLRSIRISYVSELAGAEVLEVASEGSFNQSMYVLS
jgi:hypothetical protein